jgi:hypothetical protein
VKTDLGGKEWADLELDESIKGVIKVILNAGPSQNGKFLNIHVPGWEDKPAEHRYDGKEAPW